MEFSDFYIDAGLNDVQAWDGESKGPEAGDYIGEIIELSKEPSSKKNIPQLVVKLEIISNADGSPSHLAGRNAFNRYNLEGDGRSRLRCLAEAAGVELDERGNFQASDLMNKRIAFTVVKEEYRTENLDGDMVTKTGTRVRNERSVEAQADHDDADEEQLPVTVKRADEANGGTAHRNGGTAKTQTPVARPAAAKQKPAASGRTANRR